MYKCQLNLDVEDLPFNVYRENTKTTIITTNGRVEEHYENGLLQSPAVNPKEILIKSDIYKLSGYSPAIHWLDGKLDVYYMRGEEISYPYVKINIYDNIKQYSEVHNWQLKELGII